MRPSNIKFRSAGIILLVAILVGCAKETDQSNYVQTRFVKLFNNPENAMLLGMVENRDGTYFFGKFNDENLGSSIIHAGKYGEIISRQKVELGPNEIFPPAATMLNSGEILFTSHYSSRFLKLNAQGEILVNKRWSLQVGTAQVSVPFVEESDNVLIGVSTYNTGGSSAGVFRIDPAGDIVDLYNISLANYGQAAFSISVAKAQNGKMILVGDCKPMSYKYTDKAKLFFAEFDEATETLSKVTFLDEFDDSENDFFINSAPAEDGFVMMSGGTALGTFPGTIPSKEFELFFVNNDLQVVDRRRYDIGAINSIPGDIKRTKDKGYLITGYTSSINQREYKGFMVKVAKDGQLEHSRILPYLEHLELYNGIETMDGNYMFSGGSLSFGNGKEAMTPVILKTDIRGDIE